jgi:hypothetical protein
VHALQAGDTSTMAAPPEPFHVVLDRPELTDDLVRALTAGDCLCSRLSLDTLVVFHRAAVDESEARTELRFFLDAWSARHGDPAVSLV